MPEIIQCPSCQRELQVPEEFVGRPVKCPSCGMNFVTSAPGASAPATRASEPGSYVPPAPAPGIYGNAPAGGTPGIVLGPAICLLVFGILCFVIDVFNLFVTLNKDMQPRKEELPPFFQKIMEDQEKMAGVQIAFASLFLLSSIVILAGGVQMMRLRMWGLALAASIVAMMHLQACCCLIGLPLGIWSAVILCRSDVRSLFQ